MLNPAVSHFDNQPKYNVPHSTTICHNHLNIFAFENRLYFKQLALLYINSFILLQFLNTRMEFSAHSLCDSPFYATLILISMITIWMNIF